MQLNRREMRRGRHVNQHMNEQLQTQAYIQAFQIRQMSPWCDASSSGSAASTDKFKEDLIEVCQQPSLSILVLAWWTVFNTDFLANSSALPGPHAAVWPGHGTRSISKAICALPSDLGGHGQRRHCGCSSIPQELSCEPALALLSLQAKCWQCHWTAFSSHLLQCFIWGSLVQVFLICS